MRDDDLRALDGYQLVPRVLHDVEEPDLSVALLGRELELPLVPRSAARGPWPGPLGASARQGGSRLWAVEAADAVAGGTGGLELADLVAVLAPRSMAELVTEVRRLADLGVAGVGVDLAPLAASGPFGKQEFRARSREDLAELRAAAGRPLWLFGVAGPADAEVAAEAGADVVVISSDLGEHLGSPATVDVLPEVVDAVAGMLTIASAGAVRTGVDVFRYLAVGAELVVVSGDRSVEALASELAYAFRLTGCATLADVGYDALFSPLFAEP